MRLLLTLAVVAALMAGCTPHARSWNPSTPRRSLPPPPPPVAPPSRAAPPSQTFRPALVVPPAAATIPVQPNQRRTFYTPTPEEIESAAIGPAPDNYEELIKNYLRNRIYFPDDAIYRFKRQPKRGYRPGATKQSTLFAWTVGVHVNAKTQLGIYRGPDFHLFYIRNGRIVAHSNVDAEFRRLTTGL